ncbi:M48 family metalloprotease [Bordetella petrii]|uniref:metalloprotease LoiP n=1 Tax=Bordetella petrii TaxID=94624 RepID=UPI001E533B94|nr:M48 family metalloprotease [Bordetella petrii]MCD0502612.1 M48 family metalloprotease [Bordetella petrii]
MNIRHGVATVALVMAPYSASHALDIGGLISAGSKAVQAATLSDAEIKTLSDQACAASDKESKLAKPGSKYDARLQKLAKPLGGSLNGQRPNFKVYMASDVNAWAMANGCIRVYSGLMDMMTDDELQGVIGHEMGHVALGHSKKAMQTAYTVSAARDAAAAAGGNTVAALSASQLGDLTEKFVNAQFSQSQESSADDYAFDLLKAKKLNTRGLVTAFEKLAKLDGGQSDMMSSHPSSSKRAKHMEERIAAGK